MSLKLRTHVAVPGYDPSAEQFNHGDVDTDSGSVYVTAPGRNAVEVLEWRDGDVRHVRSIGDITAAGGLLCSFGPDGRGERRVFVTARDPGRIRVLSAASGKVDRDVPVGPAPNGLAYDPRNGRLLVADIGDHSIRLIEPREGRTVWTAQPPGRPRWPVLDRARDRYLVNIREPAVVAVLDAQSGEIVATWPIPVAGPHGIDIDTKGDRAYVSCDGGAVFAVDLETGREAGQVAIAGAADVTWFNAARQRLYVCIPNPGFVDVIDVASMRLDERITTEPGTRGSALDSERQRLYVFLAKTGRIAVYDEVG
jgi:DNA-binding beta-propeller fold protein YncE